MTQVSLIYLRGWEWPKLTTYLKVSWTYHCQLNRLQKTKTKENINDLKQFLMLLLLIFFLTVVGWKYFIQFFLPFKTASHPKSQECVHPSAQTHLCLLSVVWMSLCWGALRDYTSLECDEAKIHHSRKDPSASLRIVFMNLEVFLDLRERMLNDGRESCGVLLPLGVACLS